jgi:hypothetical protein
MVAMLAEPPSRKITTGCGLAADPRPYLPPVERGTYFSETLIDRVQSKL